MMTKTQFTDAIRNIRKQIIPWISVVVIGMVALIAYLGLVYSGEAIKRAVSAYYQKYNFWDIEISSTLLMTEDDLTALRAVPGVERAEPVWSADISILTEGRPVGASLQALSTEISVPELLEGRLPAAAGECALEQQLQSILGLRIGDRVRRWLPLLFRGSVFSGRRNIPSRASSAARTTSAMSFPRHPIFWSRRRASTGRPWTAPS